MKVAIVQGTRPEVVKNQPIMRALAARGLPAVVLHTNQHRDARMCADIYASMGYSADESLPGAYRLGSAIDWLQDRFRAHRVTHVLVNGDTAAALAGAIASMYSGLECSHVEAGLRSGDPQMLEERNRIMVDSIAHQLFAYTELERELLSSTPGLRGQVHLVGNTTVDVLTEFAAAFFEPVRTDRYVYVTLHRKEFTDCPERMRSVFGVLRDMASTDCAVVFPMHPRTHDVLGRRGRPDRLLGPVEVIPPVGIFESLALQKHAAAVLTDSGCVQEEAYLLGTPCVTLRDNTERHLTVRHGANQLAGFTAARIRECIGRALALKSTSWPSIYGSPGAGGRIADALCGRALTNSFPALQA